MRPTLDDMIKVAGRELGMRKRVYPAWVRQDRLTQADADREIAGMAEIYALLKAIRDDIAPSIFAPLATDEFMKRFAARVEDKPKEAGDKPTA